MPGSSHRELPVCNPRTGEPDYRIPVASAAELAALAARLRANQLAWSAAGPAHRAECPQGLVCAAAGETRSRARCAGYRYGPASAGPARDQRAGRHGCRQCGAGHHCAGRTAGASLVDTRHTCADPAGALCADRCNQSVELSIPVVDAGYDSGLACGLCGDRQAERGDAAFHRAADGEPGGVSRACRRLCLHHRRWLDGRSPDR